MAGFTWPSSTTAQIVAHCDRLQREATAAADVGSEYLHERTLARARLNPEWEPLADHIEIWSNDGLLEIGVREEEFVSQAFALEYGDEVRPPQPLFRTMSSDIQHAGRLMREHMEAKFGPGRLT